MTRRAWITPARHMYWWQHLHSQATNGVVGRKQRELWLGIVRNCLSEVERQLAREGLASLRAGGGMTMGSIVAIGIP